MLAVPSELARRYEAQLTQRNVMTGQRPHYHKWLRYYLDFCDKYSFSSVDRLGLPAFQEKLRAKHQPESLCQQAGHAVMLYWEIASPSAAGPPSPKEIATPQGIETRNVSPAMPPPVPQEKKAIVRVPGVPANPVQTPSHNDKTDSAELKLTGASWVWVYDGLTSAIKVRHYSP